ncbi:MAG: hypothetical protein HXS48_16360 [Theionarchaea archaeon]|nr:MAG: hypothetical protein AYK19_08335 [Theionarchaea archaeon DG-70-1]MBU7028508.1 hypothetical protein [Theionarchaea archaeon]
MNTRLSLLGIGLIALALSISSWTPVVIISTHPDNINYYNRNPEIAIDGSGNSYVTWQSFDGSDNEVYWAKIEASGAPGTVQKISTHPDNIIYDDSLPQIAVDVSGNSYVTWRGSDGNDTEIYWVKVDTEGTPGIVQKVSTHPDCTNYKDWRPQIAVDVSGNSYVTWYGSDGNDYDIYWVKVDKEGTPGIVQKVSTHPDNRGHHDYHPQIAIDTSGNSYVVWHGCDREGCWEEPGDLEVYWVKIDVEGTPGTVQKISTHTNSITVNTFDSIPQIAVDASGNSYIVWTGIYEGHYDICWVKVDASETLEIAQRICTYRGSDCDDWNPQIEADSSGYSYITWESFDGSNWEIYWMRKDAEGMGGNIQNISTYLGSTLHHDRNPHIAADASGNSYVTWSSYNRGSGDQFDQRICWVKIDVSGKPGRVQEISTREEPRHFDRNSRIVVDTEGNSHVVWEGENESGNDHIFFTAHLPSPPSVQRMLLALIVIIAIASVVIVIRKKLEKDSLDSITKRLRPQHSESIHYLVESIFFIYSTA